MFALLFTLSLVFDVASSFQMRAPTFSSSRMNINMADIVDTAVGAGSFKTLAAALGAANLVSTLKGPGPFTVFAPTDDAFAKLPPGTVESLLKDTKALTNILLYHVVSGKVMASDVMKLGGQSVKTVGGESVKVSVADGVKIDQSKVVTTDIVCDNGVIHIIDTVLIPAAKPATPVFDPKSEPGVSGPFGFFDPLALCPEDSKDYFKYRESELKHGRVAMLAFLGFVVGESGFSFFGSDINGPAIFQYQQAETLFNAWSWNVVGLCAAIEGYNIVNGWITPSETLKTEDGVAYLKPGYVSGDLKFDPLGFKPKDAKSLKEMQTKEINNGRLAMLGVAGLVAQELVTGSKIF